MESLIQKLKTSLPDGLKVRNPRKGLVVVSQENPQAFWEDLMGSLENRLPAVLMNPLWPAEWMDSLIKIASGNSIDEKNMILIPTSGSTGIPKFCIHSTDTLISAAEGFRERFGKRGIIHSVNVLPQHHIGGLMPVFRSAACDGKVHFADYRDAGSIGSAEFPLQEACISLVPTQLRRMCESPDMRAILVRFGLILIGGAACPSNLLDQCRHLGLQLAPCYGSTETAAMVSALSPEDFLKDSNCVGTALPHADIHLSKKGLISVITNSVLHGYLPAKKNFSRSPFPTGDIGWRDSSGNLHISGRADRMIISGGENVHPEALENAAMASGMVLSARCVGLPDPDWGTRVELWVQPINDSPDVSEALTDILKKTLPPYARPKHIHLVTDQEEI